VPIHLHVEIAGKKGKKSKEKGKICEERNQTVPEKPVSCADEDTAIRDASVSEGKWGERKKLCSLRKSEGRGSSGAIGKPLSLLRQLPQRATLYRGVRLGGFLRAVREKLNGYVPAVRRDFVRSRGKTTVAEERAKATECERNPEKSEPCNAIGVPAFGSSQKQIHLLFARSRAGGKTLDPSPALPAVPSPNREMSNSKIAKDYRRRLRLGEKGRGKSARDEQFLPFGNRMRGHRKQTKCEDL